jgi:hypothetical protein
MRTDKFYPSKYLKAATFNGPVEAVIEAFESREMNDGKVKPVLVFVDDDPSPLVLNKTNLTALQSSLGCESDDYVGAHVELSRCMTQFQGKPTPGILLRVLDPKETKPWPPKRGGQDMDDEVPF